MGLALFMFGVCVLVGGLSTGLALWFAGSVATGGAIGILVGLGVVGVVLAVVGLSMGKSESSPTPAVAPVAAAAGVVAVAAAAPIIAAAPTMVAPQADMKCPQCQRRLLPENPICPFCNPPRVQPAVATRGRGAVEGPNGYLQIVEGPDAGQQIAVTPRIEITIGRGPGNTLTMRDAQVSTNHCKLLCANDRIMFHDLGSSNGSFLNDQPFTQGKINSGDFLRLGATTKIFFSFK